MGFAHSPSHSDRFSERLRMFRNLSGLRKIAAILLTSLIVLSVTPASAATKYSSTVSFLENKFIEGQYVEGFSAGKPDYGFTIESMLQLRSAGRSQSQLRKSIEFNLVKASNVANIQLQTGALFGADKRLLTGRAGMFLFASKVFQASNASLKKSVLTELKKSISATGELTNANGNTFDYSWVILGLQATGEKKLANMVAVKLASLARPDGGFGTDQTGDTLTSSADATGISLQALSFVRSTGGKQQESQKAAAVKAAVTWLSKNTVTANHFEAWGDWDINGTAYAAMGLKATGRKITKISAWLATKISAKDGGLTTSWSEGAGNTVATAQGYAAMIGKSYLDLLAK